MFELELELPRELMWDKTKKKVRITLTNTGTNCAFYEACVSTEYPVYTVLTQSLCRIKDISPVIVQMSDQFLELESSNSLLLYKSKYFCFQDPNPSTNEMSSDTVLEALQAASSKN